MIMNPLRYPRRSILLLLTFALCSAQAHVGPHPSVHDTVAGIIERMRRELTKEELLNMTLQRVNNS